MMVGQRTKIQFDSDKSRRLQRGYNKIPDDCNCENCQVISLGKQLSHKFSSSKDSA